MSPLQEKDKLRALTAAFIAATGVALAGLVIAIVWIGLGNKHNGEILVDCTTPGHACYERGQEQTTKAVQALINSGEDNAKTTRTYVLATEYCAKQILAQDYTFNELLNCVERYVNEPR